MSFRCRSVARPQLAAMFRIARNEEEAPAGVDHLAREGIRSGFRIKVPKEMCVRSGSVAHPRLAAVLGVACGEYGATTDRRDIPGQASYGSDLSRSRPRPVAPPEFRIRNAVGTRKQEDAVGSHHTGRGSSSRDGGHWDGAAR